mgnify:CR=1 FL=1
MNFTTILGLMALGLVAYVVSIYNFFAQAKVQIQASIQEIGNQLKRQAELIPNLETSAKAYLSHEKGILKLLADARKLTDAGKDASSKLGELLPKLQIVVESNPQLKGSDVIQNLMSELRDTSDKVMYSRRSMIDLTADYNAKLVTFPTNLIANAFGFQAEKGLETPTTGVHLQVSSSDLNTPKVNL